MNTENTKNKEEIEKIIKDKLIKCYKLTLTFPVPILEIARLLGYRITYFEVNEKTKDIAGAVRYDTKTIFINPNDSPQRKLFTAAHEIGHAVLHEEDGDIIDTRLNINNSSSPKEIEANRFAAALLMPKEEFKFRWQLHDEDLDLLANDFGTSSMATTIRAEELGLIKGWVK